MSAAKFSRSRLAGFTGTCTLPFARKSGQEARRYARAGLGLSHRPETEPVIDRAAEPGRQLESKVKGRLRTPRPNRRAVPHKVTGAPGFSEVASGLPRGKSRTSDAGWWDIETVNPTCIVWSADDRRIRRSRYSERNGPWPHLYCQSLFYPRHPNPRVKHRPKLRP